MSLAKSIGAGIVLSIVGVAVVAVGATILVPEIKDSEKSFSKYTEGTYEFDDSSSLKFDLDASEVRFHVTDAAKSYVDYKINGGTTVHTDGSLFETSMQRRYKILFWMNFYHKNEIDVYVSSLTMAEDSIDFYLNAGSVTVESPMTIKNGKFVVNAGEFKSTGLVADTLKAEINAGNLEMKKSDIKDLSFKVNAGNADIELAKAKKNYSISLEVNAGNCNLDGKDHSGANSSVEASGNLDGYTITGKVNAGNANIDFEK